MWEYWGPIPIFLFITPAHIKLNTPRPGLVWVPWVGDWQPVSLISCQENLAETHMASLRGKRKENSRLATKTLFQLTKTMLMQAKTLSSLQNTVVAS